MANEKHRRRDDADLDEDLLSVDDVAREAALLISEGPSRERIAELAGGRPQLSIESLRAGYGKMEILHGVNLQVAAGQSLCMIGPNGAGKSTVLHSIYGFTRIIGGSIRVNGEDITRLSPNQKLEHSGIAYVLQDNSVFPDMTVEENLLMGATCWSSLTRPGTPPSVCSQGIKAWPIAVTSRRACYQAESGACSKSRVRW